MQLVCGKCRHVLEFSKDPPLFCAFCGQALKETATDLPGGLQPEAPTLVPAGPLAPEPEVPTLLGGYRLGRSLGAGGMGTVHEAEEVATGRKVAVKVTAPGYGSSPVTLERFRQEGRLASRIVHPRCVFVLGVGEEVGRPYLVMELMPGKTLQDLVKEKGPLPPAEAVAKILDVLDGLIEAHRLDVIHRDVKPSNCFLEADGRVKVGDFGLAKARGMGANLTKTGAFLGTPHYASPEQVRGEGIDAQTDVYSAAATLHFLLIGQPPFPGNDPASTLARIVTDPVPSLRGLRPGIPAALDRAVLRALERDKTLRYATLEDFRTALLPFAEGGLRPAGWDIRLGSIVLDGLLLALFLRGVAWLWQLAAAEAGPASVRLTVLGLLGWWTALVYCVATEGTGDGSLGKRWLGIRVWGAGTTLCPGLVKGFFRALVFLGLLGAGWWVSAVLEFRGGQGSGWWNSPWFGWVWMAAGAVIVGASTFFSRARRGPHETLSGTQVIQPTASRRARDEELSGSWLFFLLRGRRLNQAQGLPAGVPEQIGRYAVRGALRWAARDKVLFGEDAQLGRKVILWLRPMTDPPLDSRRQELGRVTRLRWVGNGRHADWQWDAFLVPGGMPLTERVAQVGPLRWDEAYPILTRLAGELAAADRDGTLPSQLAPEQVWVHADGRVQLADNLLASDTGSSAELILPPERDRGDDRVRALDFLKQCAVLTLEGPTSAEARSREPIGTAVPLSARPVLDRLVAREYDSVDEVFQELQALNGRAQTVAHPRRARQLFLEAGLLLPAFGLLFLIGLVLPWLANTASATGHTVSGPAFAAVALASLGPALCMLGAAITLGGWSLKKLGLAVVRETGEPASALRCFARSALVWVPVWLLLVSAYRELAGARSAADFRWAWVAMWSDVVFLLMLYLVLGVAWPARGIHHRVAGTTLVPR